MFTLLVTHITIIGVTIYLHRYQAHRSIELHPLVSHFFRFWLWMTTGMITWQWVAIHRKHHATVETAEDPHSPKNHGINYFFTLLLPPALTGGVKLYRSACSRPQELQAYRHGTPNDWLECNIYAKYPSIGLFVLLLLNLLVFGLPGLIVWLVQAYWIPFWAAGVINGIGHHKGYRNYETPDASRNILPWGLVVGGEELHNNHHAFASSAKFSVKPWEFDIGWLYIRLLEILKLAKVKKVAPTLSQTPIKDFCDLETVFTLFNNRIQVMANFSSEVMRKVCNDEYHKIKETQQTSHFKSLRKAHLLMRKEFSSLDENARNHLESILKYNTTLQTVYQMKVKLQFICSSRLHQSHSSALKALQDWCKLAEESGVEALEQFSGRLKHYSLT